MRTRLESALIRLTTTALAGVCLAVTVSVASLEDTHWRSGENPSAASTLTCDTHWRC